MHTCLQTYRWAQNATCMYTWKINYVIIAEIKTVKKKKISKKEFIANSYITLSFLYIWNLKDERIDTQP